MRVWLAEKKQQGEAIARMLDPKCHPARHDHASSYELSTGDVVTWCEGHLYEQAPPDFYNPDLKRWTISALPIIPEHWQLLPIHSKKAQTGAVNRLLCSADEVVLCSDYDREGQYLGMNAVLESGCTARIKRAKVTSLGPVELKRALTGIEDISLTMPLYYSAMARSHSDWIVGMNLTRLFTCLAADQGYGEKINIGRVITPTVNLIVRRDAEIAAFKPQDYWEVSLEVSVQRGQFKAKWQPRRELLDAQGRMTDRDAASDCAKACAGRPVRIAGLERKRVKESPPLPFSLSELQIYCGARFHFSPAQVLEIAQKLYDNQYASYPRTDCRYVPESQHADAPIIMARLAEDPAFKPMTAGADLSIRSAAFSDRGMGKSSHNAIIPTTAKCDPSQLSPEEFKVYDAIRRRYVAQFYVPAEYDTVKARCICEGEKFAATGRTLARQGWRILHAGEEPAPQPSSDGRDEEKEAVLPAMSDVEVGVAGKAAVEAKQTRAPQRYTQASLVKAMLHIDTVVDDPAAKARLKETHGIGTEATRATIIKNMFDFGWVYEEKGKIHATQKAREIMGALPEAIKNPATTAMWEERLDAIVNGTMTQPAFEEMIGKWVKGIVDKCRSPECRPWISGQLDKLCEGRPRYSCPECGKALTLLKGRNGPYWRCRGCGKAFEDNGGKPLIADPAKAVKCPKCGKPLRPFRTKRGEILWACPDREGCGFVVTDKDGRPVIRHCPEPCGGLLARYRRKEGGDHFWKCPKCGRFFGDLEGEPILKIPKCPKCGREMRFSGSFDRSGKRISPHFYCTGWKDKSCFCQLDKFFRIINRKPARKGKEK